MSELIMVKLDPRLQNRMKQIESRDWTIPLVAKAVLGFREEELMDSFEKSGIPFSPINRPAEMYDDPHVNRDGGLFESALPEGGTYRALGLPFEVDGKSVSGAITDLPAIEEDTVEILSSIGINEETIKVASSQNWNNAK